jgi:uncharacterized protein YndB with AHSA1/START domain
MTTTHNNSTTITAETGTPFIDTVREFNAPPELVYRASVEPELMAQWLGPRELTTDVKENDVRPGGRYHYVQTDPEGNEYGFRGVFHAVVPAKFVVQTFEFEAMPELVSLEYATYEDLGGRTRLTNHSVFPSVESRDGAIESGMERGIYDSMDRLEELLARLA